MEFKSAECPNCAGQLQLPDNTSRVKCTYCGTEIAVQEAIEKFNSSVNPDNLLMLAESAKHAGNLQEAHDYFNRILEIDPQNHKGWYGKAITTGWLATPASLRVDEIFQGIDRALALAPQEKRPVLLKAAGSELNQLANSILERAQKEFKSLVTSETYEEFMVRAKAVIRIYQKASTLKPDDLEIFKNIIEAARRYMVRYSYSEGNLSTSLTNEEYAEAKHFIQDAEFHIQKFDPTFRAQIPEHSNCYIATAVYGSYDCDEVLTLRAFRDHTLSNYAFGRLFIRIYYEVGPRVANRIASGSITNQAMRLLLNKFVLYLRKRLEFHRPVVHPSEPDHR
ncbi:MAG TPA: CFI-box-CTERM domain-containing protein [Pyrinomonadaceae bacterium]|nr:CFI-box-CTERM domain-containing protein [Pyrinomonadaceae bacterium]